MQAITQACDREGYRGYGVGNAPGERRSGVSQQLQEARAFEGLDAVVSVELGVDMLDMDAHSIR